MGQVNLESQKEFKNAKDIEAELITQLKDIENQIEAQKEELERIKVEKQLTWIIIIIKNV